MTAARDRILELLRGVVGRECWSVMASERTDYVIVLDLGEQRRRSLRLANPRLSFLQRTYEGEYSLLVECSWRLDGPRGVVVSCYDSAALEGSMRGGLSELEGRRVTGIDVANAAYDLTVELEDGYVLRCLSTEVDPKHRRGNWSFWSPDGLVTIGPRGKVEEESHSDAQGRLLALKRRLAEDEDGPVALPRGRPTPPAPRPKAPPAPDGADDDDPPANVVDDE